jgi:hypothetical protein
MLEATECSIHSLSKVRVIPAASPEYLLNRSRCRGQFGIHRPTHICSVDCNSHLRPSFQDILGDMRLALNELFPSRETILQHIMDPRTYPTEDHIRLSRHVGFAQFFIYYTSMLLPHDKLEFVRVCDISFCVMSNLLYQDPDLQCGLVKARLKLAVSPGPTLIWNYLPVHIAEKAERKLERALERCELVIRHCIRLFREIIRISCAMSASFYI